MTRGDRLNLRIGLLFISPGSWDSWSSSFIRWFAPSYYSFCDYSVLTPAVFVGTDELPRPFHRRHVLEVALQHVLLRGVLHPAEFSDLVLPGPAAQLRRARAGHPAHRVLPALADADGVSGGALAMDAQRGCRPGQQRPRARFSTASTEVLHTHLTAPNWLQDARYAKWGIIFTTLWGVGQAVVIYLAGLQDVPRYLYEAADIDGAGLLAEDDPHQPARAFARDLFQFHHGIDRLVAGIRGAVRDDEGRRRARAFVALHVHLSLSECL